MKFFKNKFFITVLAIAVFLTIFTATLSIMGRTGPIKNALGVLATPFRWVGNKIGDAFDGFGRYFSSIDRLYRENESLKEENELLERENSDKEAVIEENRRLREYLDIEKKYPSFRLSEALIVGRATDSYSSLFTLNKGSADGIKLGMPVVTSSGLAGSVCEVGLNWSSFRCVTEASAKTGAYIPRSGEYGMIEGDISFKGTNKCSLSYLMEDSDIEIGDLVYTSGEGSIYPRDILVGRVVSIETDTALRTKSATVECAVDLSAVKYVMIVTDFEYTEAE